MFPIGDDQATTRTPAVVWLLIAANVAVYFYQVSMTGPQFERFIFAYGLIPARLFSGSFAAEVPNLLTNAFLHGGFFHILFNMWTLYVFGPALEERMGSSRFATLYIVSALAASLTHAVFNLNSTIPAVGASGAIAGVIGAYATIMPYAWIRVVIPIFIIPFFFYMPALLFAGIWFFTQVAQGSTALLLPATAGGIAWFAHIGGFIAGWLLVHRIPKRGPTGKSILGRHWPSSRNPPLQWFS